MTKDEALRLALEALEYEAQKGSDNAYQSEREAIKAALEAKDEPVAWIKRSAKGNIYDLLSEPDDGYEPVYTTPPQQEVKDEPWEKFCDSNCVWTDHHPDCKLAKDEPVAWMSEEDDCIFLDKDKPNPMDYDFWTPLYITPPQRKPLTDDEVLRLLSKIDEYAVRLPRGLRDFARAIEAAHGIKGEYETTN